MFFRKSYQSISVNELKELLGSNINLIDVREGYEYKSGHVKGAKSIPMTGIINNAEHFLKKDEKYYIICQSGARSGRVCQVLSEKGYDVVNVNGGTGHFAMMYNEHIA